jgi:hypothetical protein
MGAGRIARICNERQGIGDEKNFKARRRRPVANFLCINLRISFEKMLKLLDNYRFDEKSEVLDKPAFLGGLRGEGAG